MENLEKQFRAMVKSMEDFTLHNCWGQRPTNTKEPTRVPGRLFNEVCWFLFLFYMKKLSYLVETISLVGSINYGKLYFIFSFVFFNVVIIREQNEDSVVVTGFVLLCMVVYERSCS